MGFEDEVVRYVRFNEGVRRTRYFDSLGIPTIGVGFNLTRTDAREKITNLGFDFDAVLGGSASLTDAAIDALLADDIVAATQEAEALVDNYASLNDARRAVIIDMVFNMGAPTFAGFVNTIAAIENDDFDAASAAMADSNWAQQVGERATRNISAMSSGTLRVVGIDGSGDLKMGKEGTDTGGKTSDGKGNQDKAKEGKDGKESGDKGKDESDKGKEGKDGKDSGDKGKEGKEGKEGKDSGEKGKEAKEGKDGKEGKDQSDKGKDGKDGKDQSDKGKDGKDGKDQSDKGKDGKDGKDQSDKGKDGKDGKDQSDKGKDGKDSKDTLDVAFLAIIGEIVRFT